MPIDPDNDLVYVSDRLEPKYPVLVDQFRDILDGHGIALKAIAGTRDIWCRDFMPVPVGPGEFVRFRYRPDYLQGYDHLITEFDRLPPTPEIGTYRRSDIVLDGGNVVRWADSAIVTEKVFLENPRVGRDDLVRSLRELLGLDRLIVIPREPGDVIGHADGVVRFLDGGLVAVNEYAEVAPGYGKRLKSTLRRAGLAWVALPYLPEEARGGDIPSAVGGYANFVRVRGLVVVPSYGRREDDLPRRIIEENTSETTVVSLDCTDLAREGGVLNCVTWTIPSGQKTVRSEVPTERETE